MSIPYDDYHYTTGTSANTQTEGNEVKWTNEMQSWHVDNWMKVILRDKSKIYIGQNYNRTFVKYHSKEIHRRILEQKHENYRSYTRYGVACY